MPLFLVERRAKQVLGDFSTDAMTTILHANPVPVFALAYGRYHSFLAPHQIESNLQLP